MPRINLLPVKAARRVGNARNELITFAVVFLVMFAGLYYWYLAVENQYLDMQGNFENLQKEIGNIEKTVARVEDFKKKSQTLERKLDVIDNLKKQKVGPAKMLSDLAEILTKQRKVWLFSLEEKDGLLLLKGGAMEQENISEFQLALEQQSKFFRNITLNLVNSAKEAGVNYFQWTISCRANYAAG